MTVSNIYEAVRYCIDEEASNNTNFVNASADDCTYMNHIIRNKIPTALRWVTLYAPAETLSGVADSSSSSSSSGTIDIIVEETTGTGTGQASLSGNTITPTKTLIRVIRVKGNQWHRAILGDSLIKEDSDEYLQLKDENGAAATNDRPQAALVNTKKKKVEVWPADNNTFTLTYVRALTDADLVSLSDQSNVSLPASLETSFIYYLAYLLCCAYGDGRAKSMFEIATLNLGKTDDKQRQ